MARVHSHDTVLPLVFAQGDLRSRDPTAIPSLLGLLEQMSGPALDQLAPLVFDVLELQDEDTAAMVLKRMIAMRPAWIDQQDQSGNSALMVAVWSNKVKLVDILVGAGAVTSITSAAGLNVLDLASTTKGPFRAQTDVGNVLLTKAKFTQQEKDLALVRAGSSGSLAMARCLLAHGAGFDAEIDGCSALAGASGHQDIHSGPAIVEAMLATAGGMAVIDKGWDLPSPASPVHFAAYAGNIPVLSVLLDAGAAVNPPPGGPQPNPPTPLMAAAFGLHPAAIDLLIRKGADATAVDRNGGNALHHLANFIANSKSRPSQSENEILALHALARAGADPLQRDAQGQSPLDLAKQKKKHALASALEVVISCSLMSSTTPPPRKAPAAQIPRF